MSARDATVFLDGARVDLLPQDLLGEGGEGRVYCAGGRAVKLFSIAPTKERVAKLRAFPKALADAVVGPTSLVTDPRGDVVGYAMRLLSHAFDARKLGERRFRDGSITSDAVCAVFAGLAQVLATLHRRGVVVGDLNDGNVVITRQNKPKSQTAPDPPTSWIIDADSMQYATFPCPVAHERFLDPRLYGKDLSRAPAFSEATDWYALAVMLFSSLLYVHPYGGTHAKYSTMLRRAEAQHSALRGDVTLPRSAARPDSLTDDMLDYFTRVFDRGARDPLPASIFAARFVRCTCGTEHARARCPACSAQIALPRAPVEIRGCRATVLLETRGRIIAARVRRGTLEHVREEAGTLVRENGAIVPRALEMDPFGDAPVREEGGQLVRQDGARIGPVLASRTWIRSGERMGVAFYRVSGLTVWCVFDVMKGGLRNVTLPPIRGKLIAAECVFDGENAVISITTEESGRATGAAHFVTLSGRVVASIEGSPESLALISRATGKCVRGDHVLAATDEGLALFRADASTRTFVCVRTFPETRAWVSGGPEIFACGSDAAGVFVVHPKEIVKLSLTEQEAPS